MTPTLLELADFRAVALLLAEGNMRRAAARFGTTQPALSMRLARMEARLGQALFVRSSAGLQPTVAGTRLGRRAGRVLREAAQAEGAVRLPVGSALPARLVVGMTPCAAHTTLPLLMRRLPNTELSVKTVLGAEQGAMLRAGQIDVGLAYLPMHERGLQTRELARYELCCALPAQHPCARNAGPLTPRDLAGAGFILFSATLAPGLHARYLALLRRWALSVNGTHESESVETLLELVGRGKGAALVPSWAKTLPNERVVFRPLSKAISVAMGAAVARRRSDQPLLKALA